MTEGGQHQQSVPGQIGLVSEQTLTKQPPTEARGQFETDRAIGTAWRCAPVIPTDWHVHAHHSVVQVTNGELRLGTSTDQVTADLPRCQADSRSKGIAHDVVKDSPFSFVFLKIERKESTRAAPGK